MAEISTASMVSHRHQGIHSNQPHQSIACSNFPSVKPRHLLTSAFLSSSDACICAVCNRLPSQKPLQLGSLAFLQGNESTFSVVEAATPCRSIHLCVCTPTQGTDSSGLHQILPFAGRGCWCASSTRCQDANKHSLHLDLQATSLCSAEKDTSLPTNDCVHGGTGTDDVHRVSRSPSNGWMVRTLRRDEYRHVERLYLCTCKILHIHTFISTISSHFLSPHVTIHENFFD